ncbi:class II aldolase/adducin family protein [Streptomyces sp. NPDC047081]|uniref:class II aldolase/adducin family protein n=1 Tax=Streptomyces sp. NPDC047081 TaxID=3154706 RepID=UPI0033F3229A
MPTENPSSGTPAADIVTGCHVLGSDDHGDPVWGHVSLRDPQGRGVWLKSGGRGFDEVSYEDIALIDFDGTLLEGSGPPPREYPLHTEVLRARPDIDSVVHCHPPYATALPATGQPLYAFSNGAGPFAGGVPRYEEPVGLVQTAELGAAVADRLGDARALFLVGHGIIAVGSGVATAVTTAVLLERACRLQILATWAGGVAPELRNPGKRYVHAESDGYLLRTWEYLVRRLDTAG